MWLVLVPSPSCTENSVEPPTHSKTSAKKDAQGNPMPVSDATLDALDSLHNDHLRWSGTLVGLVPTVHNEATHGLIATGEAIDALLVEKLRDPQAFAVAHVILTQRAKDAFSSDGNQWNHLRVDLTPDGSVVYHSDNREPLYRLWKSRVTTRRAGP